MNFYFIVFLAIEFHLILLYGFYLFIHSLSLALKTFKVFVFCDATIEIQDLFIELL